MTYQTDRTHQVHKFLAEYIKQNGYAPTVTEIAKALGLRSPRNVLIYLGRLEKQGFIAKPPRAHRAIKILVEPEEENKPTVEES